MANWVRSLCPERAFFFLGNTSPLSNATCWQSGLAHHI